MWRVSALDRDGREIGHYELRQGELSIGRDSDRELILPSASVSRRHARIVLDSGRTRIIDEGSSNGVLVNGVRISAPTEVGPSTRIDVAEFRIAIEPLPARSDGPSVSAPVPAPAPQARPAPPDPTGRRLIAEGGPYDGRTFELALGTLQVGRSMENDLVFDDPSLSRKHACFRHDGPRLEVEDLGSSNGTFVNGRKVARAVVGPGDVVRFGDLSFRCEGGEHGSTRSVASGIDRLQLYALTGAAVTFLLVVLAVVFLVRKVPTVQASGRDAIARLSRTAETHVAGARKSYEQRKYAEAKAELDQALELDPGSIEGRRLARLIGRAPEEDRLASAAQAGIAIGDRKGLEQALHALDDLADGGPAKSALVAKLEPALQRYGSDACAKKAWGECAWALCRAFQSAPTDARPPAALAQRMSEAEHKLKREPCRAQIP
jgi:pSer/pThr/pTyr-binding forkhead associated (FHA) protein